LYNYVVIVVCEDIELDTKILKFISRG